MGRNWTDEQRAAIEAKRSSILVAAAAGAGKTAVLVQRIIDSILDEKNGTDIDHLLVVTFTNAAAAEMRERIGKAIEKRMGEEDKTWDRAMDKRLQRQLTLLNKASITTIHSFCLEVIRGNFHLLELDPQFKIGDETETTLIKYEALDEVFEESYETENDRGEFLSLVDCYGGRKDDLPLQEVVLNLYDFIQSSADPNKWLENSCSMMKQDENFNFGKSIWAAELLKSIGILANSAMDSLEEALAIIDRTPELLPYREEFARNRIDIAQLYQGSLEGWEEAKKYSDISFGRLKAVKGISDEKDYVKGIRDRAKDDIKEIKTGYFGLEEKCDREIFNELKSHMTTLSNLVLAFEKCYRKKKEQKNLVDFNDLEHFCLKLLRENPDIAEGYSNKFHEIFVDEYQDSNLVQEEIIGYISREKSNIFMVGDVKQSIYRFRQAKPELFMEKYEHYSKEKGEETRLIKLYRNFRSRKNVIDSTNFVFRSLMSKTVGEIDYDEEEALIFGADFEDPKDGEESLELHILDLSETWDSEEEEDRPDNIQAEARMVGDVINDLVRPRNGKAFQVWDQEQKAFRDADYKDIVILLRATTNWADAFAEELQDKEIPVYADAGSGYFRTVEVLTLLSVLTIIDNPLQDIPLIAVLRSPIAGFTPEELIDIRTENKDVDFYTAMVEYANKEEGKKAGEFIERLEIWREKSGHLSVDELIWYLFDETNYYSFVGALVGGTQRQANLRILVWRAKQFEGTNYKGLFNFLNFINKMKARSGDMGSAKLLTDNEDVVRIMSIHKSKGLEFPIVILSGTGKAFNMMDARKKILFHQDMGFGPQYISSEKKIQYPSIAKIAIGEKIKNESLSEEMRILYVAMTRAKEKLIITGTAKDLKKSREKWQASGITDIRRRLSPSCIMKAKGYLDWVAPIFVNLAGGSLLSQDDTIIRLTKGQGVQLPKVEVRVYTKQELRASVNKAKTSRTEVQNAMTEALTKVDLKEAEMVYRNLNWIYPYEQASRLFAKKSVSEIKKAEVNEDTTLEKWEALIKKPFFMEGEKVQNAAEKGSVIHRVLQHIDFSRVNSREELTEEIEGMMQKNILTKDQKQWIPKESLFEFIKSPLGQRVKSAKLSREVPFCIEVPYSEIDKTLDENSGKEKFMLQGIIDCYFIEEGEAVLLDYKTGRMYESYNTQLEYYERALREAGIEVKEKHIVFL